MAFAFPPGDDSATRRGAGSLSTPDRDSPEVTVYHLDERDVIVDVNNNTNCTISSVTVSLKKITRSTVVFKDAFTDKQALPYGIL